MNILTLNEIKAHCRIDGDAEDDVLEIYATAAEEVTFKMLNRSYYNLVEEEGELPVAVKQAMLMLVSHSYKVREPVAVGNMYAVPYTVDMLLKPYMIL